ncbi:tetratricopeptide repeat protein [Streptomyces sp. NPDC096013]|uniref:tetratricopeptide repeat protein n=1 Tax=Streptomyces sp. NPDC096013 TaxID=3366069 RepID=UPI00381207C0
MDETHDADVFAALRRLGRFKKEVLGGRPSDRHLGRLVGIAPTTVGDWFRGSRFPQRIDGILIIVSALRQQAISRGLSADAIGDLLDEDKWRDLHRSEATRRARTVATGTARSQALRLLSEGDAERIAKLPDPPRPFLRWTPKSLGIHPAVKDAHDETIEDFVLPSYVPRAHDAELLRELLSIKSKETASLLIVRGGSCSGKTRTAYEALKSAMPEWNLIYPKSVDSLLAALNCDAVQRETILWLDDAHHFLLHEKGEEVAAALRRLLEHDGPLVIMATLWTMHHRLLVTPPSDASERDKNANSRELLKQGSRIDVPPAFGDVDLRSLHKQAIKDRSLSLAARNHSGSVTQFLAAAPDLLDHYEQADGVEGLCGKAVISAAIDARRLGIIGPIPKYFIKAAAPGYMADDVRSRCNPETWFDDALSYATQLIKGVASAFVSVPHPTDVGSLPDVVELADYLDYYGQANRTYAVPPTSFWAAAKSLEDTDHLMALANAAQDRHRLKNAYMLYGEAARRGNIEAMRRVAFLREDSGNADEAEVLRHQAAEKGSVFALRDLARAKEIAGDSEGAEKLARQAISEENYPTSLWEIAVLRLRAGNMDSARSLLKEAELAGSIEAAMDIFRLAIEEDDLQLAEEILDSMSHEDYADMICELAYELKDKGKIELAEKLFRRAADLGDLWALGEIAIIRKDNGRRGEARKIFSDLSEAGEKSFLIELGRMSEEDGRIAEAELLYISAAIENSFEAPFELARLLDETGRKGEADRIVSVYAETGNFSPLMDLARLRKSSGDRQGEIDLLRVALDLGNSVALSIMASNCEEVGDLFGAEEYATRAANGGYSYALLNLAKKYKSQDKWRRILVYGLESDGSVSEAW